MRKSSPRRRAANGQGIVVSDEPGTLWRLCLDLYFQVNPRIACETTKLRYRDAFRDFTEMLGRPPVLADLNDDTLVLLSRHLQGNGLAVPTINQRIGKLRALWEWCARRKLVDQFPTWRKLREPRRVPKAWTKEQLRQLIVACQTTPGQMVPGITAADWWTGVTLVQWDSLERIGALLQCKWEFLDTASGLLLIPSEVRKGNTSDMEYELRPGTLAVLARIQAAGYDLMFPRPWTTHMFYYHYTKILVRAGLPTDRKSKTHRIRRSGASHLQAMGYSACEALGHSDPRVARDSYLDPGIVGAVRPSRVLFDPLSPTSTSG